MSTSTTSFSPPEVLAGHLGHLNPAQAAALETLKTNLTKAGLWSPGGTHADEPTLLRFLRARRFDPVRAQKQFADTAAWRAQLGVDKLFAGCAVDEFEDTKRFYPRWTGRRDQQGLPIYVYRLAALQGARQKELDKVPSERRYQRISALYELMTRLVFPLCTAIRTPAQGAPTPVSSVTTIIDLSDISLRALVQLRGHLQQASTLATANYPETLSATIIVHSPSFFSTIWGWVKGWFDEGTRNKVHVLGKDMSVLRQLIDPADLPKAYGGELDWTFDDPPALDVAAQAVLGATMPRGPCWLEGGQVVRPSDPAPDAGTAGVTEAASS